MTTQIPKNALLHEFHFYAADEDTIRGLQGSENWDLLDSSRIESDSFIREYVPRFFRDMDLDALDQAFEDVLISGTGSEAHPFELMFALNIIVSVSSKVLPRLPRSDAAEIVNASKELADAGISLDLTELAAGQNVWEMIKGINYPTLSILSADKVRKIIREANNAIDRIDELDDYAAELVEMILEWSIEDEQCLVSFFF